MTDSDTGHPTRISAALQGVRPSRARVALAALLRLGSAAAALTIPWAAGIAVTAADDGVVASARLPSAAALLLGAFAGFLALEYVASTTLAATRLRAVAALRTAWFDRLQRTKMQDIDESSRHDWLSMLTQDAGRIVLLVADLPVRLVFACVLAFGAFWAMASLSFPLACLALVAMPVVFIIVRWVGRAIARAADRWRVAEVELVRHTDQTFGALAAVKSFAAEDARTARYGAIADEAAARGLAQQRIAALMGPAVQFVAFASLIVLAFAWNASASPLDSAKLTTFVLYGLLFTVALRTMGSAVGTWSDAHAALERFAEVATLLPEPRGGDTFRDEVRGELTLDDVEFAYSGRGAAVFPDGVSLRLIAGDTTVIVGANGAGKTTLISLLLRFREPDRGHVRLDGVDISTLDLTWYRRQFAVAHQDPVLLGATLRDNVTLGRPDATDAEIDAACEAALLDEVIASLPAGLDTRIGDGGAQLSGGQRQRVALARAFLIDAPVLVLDEATSMFDPDSERRFITRNRERFASRTVLWITHGPGPLAIADRVVEVREGGFRAPLRPVEAHG